jgi:lipoprotein-anchoring transpeptidase ErfK/SrfK
VLAALFAAATTATATPRAVPDREVLTNARVAHWAPVLRSVAAHRRPDAASSVVAKVGPVTSDWTQNIVLVLEAIHVRPAITWYRVRLPILPNNSTGWVPRDALGNLYEVHTHLYVNRATFTARLERAGRTIFKTRVGIGRPATPTPAGEFYIRDQVAGFDDPFYGPVAFGTNARSRVLTDWPGGGFIGIHGTNRPEILPGAVSHGCIRMVNRAIVRLSRLLPLGTPLTIT